MRPRLLDLFCGAGGAAMGYHRAGFDVVGVDIKPQPHYPFEFIQADFRKCFDVFGGVGQPPYFSTFDAIHASPPCQAHSVARSLHDRKSDGHIDLLTPCRPLLMASGLPWVIENVPGAPMRKDAVLFGSQFGLPLRRPRWFEASFPLSPFLLSPSDRTNLPGPWPLVFGHSSKRDGTTAERAEAMGIDWMTGAELSQAIPPAYTEWIGRRLLAALRTTKEGEP